jgi:tRNA-uridine 2-sulfurtransferase
MRRPGPILVAMSGGVDSSVAAAMLKARGHDVIGMTMQIWQESQTDPRHAGCCSLGAVEDARRVARILDIPHYVMNFKEEFRQNVIENFIDEYAAGRTPNPCVQCNKTVKFEILMEKMRELGCQTLVTGHYARTRKNADGTYRLLRARGNGKDQSYVLYMLDQAQLACSYFPLGEIANKGEAREMARSFGLPVADKPDSQEICFVSEAGGYSEFIKKHRPGLFRKGEVVDTDGNVLGEHEGHVGFTVGQRRGVGVSTGKALYVIGVQAGNNRIVVGAGEQLLTREVLLRDMVWGCVDGLAPVRVKAKIRYNMDPQAARLIGGPEPKLIFDEPVRAVTPGQMAVAYRGESVAAGGIIRLKETQAA